MSYPVPVTGLVNDSNNNNNKIKDFVFSGLQLATGYSSKGGIIIH